MIETTCLRCGCRVSLEAGAVILGRHLPAGDGTVIYQCTTCRNPVSLPVTADEVMAVVFAGARPVDVESVI